MKYIKYILSNYKKSNSHIYSLALTSITLISIVPFLAIAVSILKGTGYYTALKENTLKYILTQAEKHASMEAKNYIETIATNITTYIDNTNFTTLGIFGLITLLYTSVLLISRIEDAMNNIFNVSGKKISRRIIEYISSIVILPVLLITSSALITLAEIKLGRVGVLLSKILPFLFIWTAFSFIYHYIPNTKITPKSSVVSGFISTLLWVLAQIFFFKFQIKLTKYNAIYSTFAALPVFIIWLNISYSILLLGAHISKLLERGIEEPLTPQKKLETILKILKNAYTQYNNGEVYVKKLKKMTGLNLNAIYSISNTLKENGIADILEDKFIFIKNPSKISLYEIYKMAGVVEENPEKIDIEKRFIEELKNKTLVDI